MDARDLVTLHVASAHAGVEAVPVRARPRTIAIFDDVAAAANALGRGEVDDDAAAFLRREPGPLPRPPHVFGRAPDRARAEAGQGRNGLLWGSRCARYRGPR